MSDRLPLRVFASRLAVCRLPAGADLPDWATAGELLALIRTPDELTVVCNEARVPASVRAERGWRCLRVEAVLDFSMVGVLARISQVLAEAGISIFVLSTFDTDYILVQESRLEPACQALERVGYAISGP